MKKIVLGLAVAVLSLSAMAQTSYNNSDSSAKKSERKHFRLNNKYEQLNLSNDQKAQINALNQSFGKDMKDLKSQNLPPEEQKTKRMALLKDRKQKMEGILTPEQLKQAKELREQYKDQKTAGAGKHEGARTDKMVKDLNLSADQTTKIKSLNSDVANTIKGINSNSSLSEDDKKQQIKVVLKKHREDLQNILTAEQKDQWKSERKNHRFKNTENAGS